jgi:two-component system, cell cycle sensor histidine kinase and response regulator CckA
MARAPRKRPPSPSGGAGKVSAHRPSVEAGASPRRPGASRRESDRRLVRSYRALAQCNRALVRATSEPDLLGQLCRILVQVGEYQLAWVGYAEDDPGKTVRRVAQAGLSDGYLESVRISWADDALGRGPTGTCIRTGTPAVNHNSSTDPAFEPWRAAALERGFRSSSSLPLLVDGRVIGALMVYSARSDAFDADEQELLLRLSEDLAFGIAALRAREERRRAEAALRESDALLRAIADSSPDPIFARDRDGRYTFANAALLRLLGATPGQLLGRTGAAGSVLGAPDSPLLVHHREVLESGEARSFVETVAGVAGPRRFLTSRAPLRAADGRVVGTVGIAKDFTDRERQEEELRRSEARFRTLADESPVGIFEVDPQGQGLYLNRAGVAILGGGRPGVDPRRWGELIHPDDAPRVLQGWRAAAAAGTPFAAEHRLLRPDGQEAWVRVQAGPLRDASGAVTGFLGVLVDVTESRRAARALAERKDELDAILRSALDGFWLVDTSGRLLAVNDSACEMLGYSREELTGLHLGDVDAAMDAEEIRARMQLVIQEDRGRFDSRHRRKDGTLVDVEVSVQHLPFGGGRVVAFIRDLTARKQAEEQLRQAQKLEAVGRLAGGIAHDFTGLLDVIRMGNRYALDHASAEGRLRTELEAVGAAADKARELTQQLLAFSRRQVLQSRRVDLNEVVRDQEPILARLVGDGVALRLELEPALGAVQADPSQLQQVVLNLVINARDAMPEGGTLSVRTANVEQAGDLGPAVRLEVEDSGVGMDDATRRRIFEPFFTTKPIGKGTGLGLATVFGIVKQSGGTIEVRSQPGRGSCFEVLLPRLPETRPEGAAGGTVAARATILVIEDEEMVRRITAKTLQRAGFDVLTASTLEEALERIQVHSREPAVLLTDVRMPGRTGPEVAAALTQRMPRLRTVYMSGYTPQEAIGAGMPGTGAIFIQKPYTADGLVRRIREVVEGAGG